MDMRLVTADVGTVLPQIQVHHKYTWNGRDLDEVGSHRPLGLADPCLSLVSDILYIRVNDQIRCKSWIMEYILTTAPQEV